MKLLNALAKYGVEKADEIAVKSALGELTYRELTEGSDILADYLDKKLGDNRNPIMVYGHKNPYILLCFIACAKAGRTYCPIDISLPLSRVEEIAKVAQPPVILSTEQLEMQGETIISLEEIKRIINEAGGKISSDKWNKPEDVYYIIFTSGSTGTPKGVQITADNLSNFLVWSKDLAGHQGNETKIFLNQAPFSFDLSVLDVYTSLYTGGTLFLVDKEAQQDMSILMDRLGSSDLNVWVSTPSFADVCLSNPEFDESLLRHLEVFLFCGETLTRETAKRLAERFPKAKIVNLYGPTEATVSVTGVEITAEMIAGEAPLPIGYTHEGTEILIEKEDGTLAADGEQGEILIRGNTVSPGYFKNEEKTKEVFLPGNTYKTGDEGFLKEGMLHYCGRRNLQIKLHGYRI
ncbi:MAG: D-alanine--poly(phosphoribitol) ligase subunit DltA, partial [Anaerovoracaceae bacterium]